MSIVEYSSYDAAERELERLDGIYLSGCNWRHASFTSHGAARCFVNWLEKIPGCWEHNGIIQNKDDWTIAYR